MGIKLITAPTLEPITSAQVKAQCSIDSDDTSLDTLVDIAIKAARAAAENRMRAYIMKRTVEQYLDAFPEAEIEIEVPPAWNKMTPIACPLSITSVGYTDAAGDDQTLDTDLFTLDEKAWPFWVLPAVDTEWPTPRDQANAVVIRYEVGYTLAADIPADVRAWLLLTAAFLVNNREAFDATGKVSEIPNRWVDSLLDPYTVWKV